MVEEQIIAVHMGTTVVAVVKYHQGEVFDWAAYQQRDRTMPVHEIADHGDKIYHDLAFQLYPQLPEGKWRP